MRGVRHVGELQAVFSPALADALRTSRQPVLRLAPRNLRESWIYQRLTHDVPSYRGVAIGGRVQLAEPLRRPITASRPMDG